MSNKSIKAGWNTDLYRGFSIRLNETLLHCMEDLDKKTNEIVPAHYNIWSEFNQLI